MSEQPCQAANNPGCEVKISVTRYNDGSSTSRLNVHQWGKKTERAKENVVGLKGTTKEAS